MNKDGLSIEQSPVSANSLGSLIKLIDGDVISGKMAKSVFEEMCKTGKEPSKIVEDRGLKQITDDSEIKKLVETVLGDNPSQVQEFVGGNERLFAFFVGQVMKLSKGTANPKKVNELVTAALAARRN